MGDRKRVTIQDVAVAAGVSAGTVSRVLNGREGDISISAATQEHVLEAVKRLGYRPNSLASALRSERTWILGAIMRDIAAPFSGFLARTLQRLSHANGMELLIGSTEQDSTIMGRQVRVISSDWFDGAFLVGNLPNYQDITREWQQYRKPLVAVASGLRLPIPSVNVNEHLGLELALDHLIELGHHKIAFLGTTTRLSAIEREQLFEACMREREMPIIPTYVRNSDKTRTSAREATLALLALPSPPTAIVCSNDIQAVGALQAATTRGLRVPDDLSIVGYDDIYEAADSLPPLTTIHQPVGELAQQAFSLLMRLIDRSQAVSETRILIPPKLVVRASTARPLPARR